MAYLFVALFVTSAHALTTLPLHRRFLTGQSLVPPRGESAVPFPFYNFLNAEYVLNITVGTPASTFRVALSTALGNSWLPTPACNDYVTSPACIAQNKYNSAADTSYKPCEGLCTVIMPQTDNNATLIGSLGNTTVTIGGLTASTASLALISLEPLPRLTGAAFDGIIGLGAQNGSTVPLLAPPVPLLNVLLEEGAFTVPKFSFFFNRGDAPGAVGHSAMMIGGDDFPTYSVGPSVELAPYPIWSAVLGLWAVTMDYVFVNAFLTTACDHCIAVLDSASPYISAPPSTMQKVTSLVGPIAQDCSNVGSLPNVTLQLGGIGFLLTPADYVLHLPLNDFNQTLVCSSAFQEFDASGGILPLWILGTSFLRAAYTSYDMVSKNVTLAAAKTM